jgi:Fe(3+) dicitrate transport protein
MLLGLGSHYALTENFGLLAGIHQGFSPVAPGQEDDVQPEKSVNYEAGFRYQRIESGSAFEAIGFLSQYSNMVAQCSFSVGCSAEDLDREFNGGEVRVQGVESLLSHRFDVPGGLFLPVRVAYTWSQSEFQSSFLSGNPQLGVVEAGDELPYLPAHQASGRVGIAGLQWGLDVGLTFADRMREVAGSGTDADFTDAILSLDASARYAPKDWLELYLKGENLTHQTPLASRRPYGARPGKPLLVLAGIKAFY